MSKVTHLVRMRLLEDIAAAFPGSIGAVSDADIQANPDLTSLVESVALPLLVPAYMAWCVKNADRSAELVHDYTLRSLAEFGRTRNPKLRHLNFALTCTADQRQVVAKYLRWSLNPELLLDTEQAKRAIKRWSTPTAGSEASE